GGVEGLRGFSAIWLDPRKSAPTRFPDPFGGPAARPLGGREVLVRGRRAGRRAQLEEILDLEAVLAQQSYPDACRQRPVDPAFAELHTTEVVERHAKLPRLPLLLPVPGRVVQRVGRREGQRAAGAKDASALG